MRPLGHRARRDAYRGCGRGGRAAKQTDGFGLEHSCEVSTLTDLSASALTNTAAQISGMALTLKARTQMAIDAGYSVGALATAAGVSSPSVSHWLAGRTKKIKAETAVGLESLTGWNSHWWITGKGPQKKASSPDEPPPSPAPAEDPLLARFLNAFGELDEKQRERLVEDAETMAAEKLGRELLTNRMGMKKLAPAPDHKVSRAYGTPKKPAKGRE